MKILSEIDTSRKTAESLKDSFNAHHLNFLLLELSKTQVSVPQVHVKHASGNHSLVNKYIARLSAGTISSRKLWPNLFQHDLR